MARCCSSQTWVMPTFSPTIALLATCSLLPAVLTASRAHANAPPGNPERSARMVWRDVPAHRRSRTSVVEGGAGGATEEPNRPVRRYTTLALLGQANSPKLGRLNLYL